MAGGLASLVVPGLAMGAETPVANINLCVSDKFYETVTQYYNIAIGVAILSAILVIVIGSYRMVVAAGNAGMIAGGKKMLLNAILGLSIAVLSGVILNTLGGTRILGPGTSCNVQATQTQ